MTYAIDPEIASWASAIHASAAAWSSVSGSGFRLIYLPSSNNVIDQGGTDTPVQSAITAVHSYSTSLQSPIEWVETHFNKLATFVTHLHPGPNEYSVQNVMTHEFGHWVYLDDIHQEGCEHVTMWYQGPPGETLRISLEFPDMEGLRWKYPQP